MSRFIVATGHRGDPLRAPLVPGISQKAALIEFEDSC
jgi:hypothetical protein